MNHTGVSSLSRMTYRLILRIHPGPFRERFGEEMLGIFDEECQRGSARLLVDGALSAVRQHVKEQDTVEAAPAGFSVGVTSGISLRRIVQGGVLASIIAYGLMFLLARNGMSVVPVRAAAHSCTPVLRAPSRIAYPPKPPSR